jgi:hypothetical protein
LQLNLPTTGVNDLTIHGADLIAATEGRSLWVLDDYTPLRHLTKEMLAGGGGATLFPPAPAYRLSPNQNRDTPLPLDEPRAANPPAGAVIDYLLPAGVKGPVTLEVVDAKGQVVRRFANNEMPQRPEAGQYFDDDWLQAPRPLPAEPGHNRFTWDLRMPRPRALDYDFSIAAVPGADTPVLPQGLFILPGSYQVRLTVGGRALTQPLTVTLDPRVKATPAELQAQHDFYQRISDTLARVTEAQEAVKEFKGTDKDAAKAIGAELAVIAGALTPIATDVESVDRTPTGPQREVVETYGKRLETALGKWEALERSGR